MSRLAEGFGYRKTAYGRETSDLEAAALEDLQEKGRISDERAGEGMAFLESLAEWRSALAGRGPGARILTPQVREMLPTPQTTVSRDPEDGDSPVSHVAIPMHLDTLVEDTYMTIIIYLRSVPAVNGGQTLFPLATVDGASPLPEELQQASREMISSGLWGLETSDPRLDAAAERLAEQAAASGRRKAGSLVWGYGGHGLAVSAKRGDALCFYTRKPDGSIDPAAWHAVASLNPVAGAGRCVCQLFHCLPQVDEAEEFYGLSGLKPPTVPGGNGGTPPVLLPLDQVNRSGPPQQKLLDQASNQIVLPTSSPANGVQLALYKQSQYGILHGKLASAFCKTHGSLRPCTAAGVSFEVG